MLKNLFDIKIISRTVIGSIAAARYFNTKIAGGLSFDFAGKLMRVLCTYRDCELVI